LKRKTSGKPASLKLVHETRLIMMQGTGPFTAELLNNQGGVKEEGKGKRGSFSKAARMR